MEIALKQLAFDEQDFGKKAKVASIQWCTYRNSTMSAQARPRFSIFRPSLRELYSAFYSLAAPAAFEGGFSGSSTPLTAQPTHLVSSDRPETPLINRPVRSDEKPTSYGTFPQRQEL